MSECAHFWRAITDRVAQCRKCGETVRNPCQEPECVALRAKLTAIKRLSLLYLDAAATEKQKDELRRLVTGALDV